MELIQYSIILVNLDPTSGSEMKKTRPCVIVSPENVNKYLRTVVVCPLTTNTKEYPTRVSVIHEKKSGMIAIDQIRTIDKTRIKKLLGELSEEEKANCKKIINEIFVK
jgi:mRNA interferase MazF